MYVFTPLDVCTFYVVFTRNLSFDDRAGFILLSRVLKFLDFRTFKNVTNVISSFNDQNPLIVWPRVQTTFVNRLGRNPNTF